MMMHGGYSNQLPPRPGMVGGPVTAEEAEAMQEMARQHIAHAATLSQVAQMPPGMPGGFAAPLQPQFSPQQMFAQQMAVQQMVAQQMAAAHNMRPQLAAQLGPPMAPPMAPPMQGSTQQLASHLARRALARGRRRVGE